MAWWRLSLGRGEGPETRPRAAAGLRRPPSAPPDPDELGGILTERVTFRAPATLMLSDSGISTAARFAALADGELCFDLASVPDAARIEPLAACCVSFVHRQRALVFLSQILRVDAGSTPENPRQVALRVPSAISGEDRRSAPRSPNLRASGMGIGIVVRGGRRFASIPLNASASGALVEFPEGAAPRLRRGAETVLAVEYGELSGEIPATVRRIDGPRVAFVFAGALRRDGVIAAPPPLPEILARLSAASSASAPSLSA